jgi:hypothetical protein
LRFRSWFVVYLVVRVSGIGALMRSKAHCWSGGDGELVDGLADDADGVAGQGGQVVQEVTEAADGLVPGAGLNRPGFCGGSQSTGEWDDGSSTEVSGRAA